ncbi:MAG: hypothetical protein R3Y06_10115 [Faecalibacterium sp.]
MNPNNTHPSQAKKPSLQQRLRYLKPLQWVILLLSVFTVLNFSTLLIMTLDELSGYQPPESSVLYDLRSNDFYYMRTSLGYYSDAEIAKSETLSECYHLYYYFENSFFYQAYTKLDDTDTAAQYLAACQESAEGSGSLSYYITEIDALFSEME